MRSIHIIQLFALLFLVHEANGQSGWTKAKGEGFFQTSFSTFGSKEYFNLGGEKLITNQFNQ